MGRSYKTLGRGVALCAFLISMLMVGAASAQNIIKQPGRHPRYSFEAEPHLVIMDHYGHATDGGGPGFRGTITVVDNGFVKTINNSIGIGFGADWLVFGDEHCHGGPGNFPRCHDHDNQFFLPVVMQWNFWLHPKWSVFGEPGLALIFHDEHDQFGDSDLDLDFDPFILMGGGRFHFSDSATLTMRIGFPASLSVGVSFLL